MTLLRVAAEMIRSEVMTGRDRCCASPREVLLSKLVSRPLPLSRASLPLNLIDSDVEAG
jgi:hypothetical protein